MDQFHGAERTEPLAHFELFVCKLFEEHFTRNLIEAENVSYTCSFTEGTGTRSQVQTQKKMCTKA